LAPEALQEERVHLWRTYVVVQAGRQRIALTAETVEKVQMANSDNFCTVKNHQLTGHRKSKNA
jgi:hypothetical protein